MKKSICIGIPRAMLYYRYGKMWETFFNALDCEVIVSPETDKKILEEGSLYSVDETCLSSKIFLGHVKWLIGKCDRIFIPRISNFGRDKVFCTEVLRASGYRLGDLQRRKNQDTVLQYRLKGRLWRSLCLYGDGKRAQEAKTLYL